MSYQQMSKKELLSDKALSSEPSCSNEMSLEELQVSEAIGNVKAWLLQRRTLLESDWMLSPIGEVQEEKEADGKRLKRIPVLSRAEEGALASMLKSKKSNYELCVCIGKERFEREYKQSIAYIPSILKEINFHTTRLEDLLREIAQRHFLLIPPYEVVVYFSEESQQIKVWSSLGINELYKKMRALS